MEYIGRLYGKVGNKYFDTGKTSEDYDRLESRLSPVTDQIGEEVAWLIWNEARSGLSSEAICDELVKYPTFDVFKSSHPDLFRKTEINIEALFDRWVGYMENNTRQPRPHLNTWEWLKQQPEFQPSKE